MRSTGFLLCILAAGSGAVAQAVPRAPTRVELLRCEDVFEKLQGATTREGSESPAARFTAIFARLRASDPSAPKGAAQTVQMANATSGPVLLVRGSQEEVDLVKQAIALLRAEDPQQPTRLRVQCTLVTLPAELAASHGLAAGRRQPVEEAAMGRLVKAAVAAKGSLLNLPEAAVQPLVPFVVEPRVGKPVAGAAAAESPWRCRGEAMRLGPDEALLALQLVRGKLPEDRTKVPKTAAIDEAFRLKVGTGVAIAAPKDAEANTTVLWVRLVAIDELTAPGPAGR